jgi:hypothetical protein
VIFLKVFFQVIPPSAPVSRPRLASTIHMGSLRNKNSTSNTDVKVPQAPVVIDKERKLLRCIVLQDCCVTCYETEAEQVKRINEVWTISPLTSNCIFRECLIVL